MQHTLYDEVIPTLDLPKEDLMNFARAVTNRFDNPFIRHELLSICLNSVSKWRARCLPSLLRYHELTGKLPARLTFSLAALMALYQGGTLAEGSLTCTRDGQPYTLRDDPAVLAFFAGHSNLPAADQAKLFLSNSDFFGQDLTQIPGLAQAVTDALTDIKQNGMRAALVNRFEK